MIERYSLPEMDAIFSDAARFARYLDIELHALDGQAAIGAVPERAVSEWRLPPRAGLASLGGPLH